jgi:hypothetical protein
MPKRRTYRSKKPRSSRKPSFSFDDTREVVDLRTALKRTTKYLPSLSNSDDADTAPKPLSGAVKAEAVQIVAAWNKQLASIIETGRRLINAKRKFPGEFHAMIKQLLPFSVRTAQRLMVIAEHPVLSDATHGSRLPPSWRTLWVLTGIDNDQLLLMLKDDGPIHVDLERKQAEDLVERCAVGLYFQRDLVQALVLLRAIKRAWSGEELARKLLEHSNSNNEGSGFVPGCRDIQEIAQWLSAWHAEATRLDAEVEAAREREWAEAEREQQEKAQQRRKQWEADMAEDEEFDKQQREKRAAEWAEEERQRAQELEIVAEDDAEDEDEEEDEQEEEEQEDEDEEEDDPEEEQEDEKEESKSANASQTRRRLIDDE